MTGYRKYAKWLEYQKGTLFALCLIYVYQATQLSFCATT